MYENITEYNMKYWFKLKFCLTYENVMILIYIYWDEIEYY